jgi:hypothetical protein
MAAITLKQMSMTRPPVIPAQDYKINFGMPLLPPEYDDLLPITAAQR